MRRAVNVIAATLVLVGVCRLTPWPVTSLFANGLMIFTSIFALISVATENGSVADGRIRNP